MAQLPLDLQFMSAAGRDDFIIGECNRLATAWIDRWPDWPGQYRVLNLVGPQASGKSHLAAIWGSQTGAATLTGLSGGEGGLQGRHFVLDGVAAGEGWDEEALFHLVNRTAGEGGSLLILTREPASQMQWRLVDLASRLRAITVVNLDPPDDAILRQLLEKYFADRQLAISLPVLDYMVSRMERSFQAVQTVAAAMDSRSLAERRDLTLPLARDIMLEFADGAHARQPALPTGLQPTDLQTTDSQTTDSEWKDN